MPKSWKITIKSLPLTLTLAPPKKRGYCFNCHLYQEIRIISEHPLWIGDTQTFEERKFCWDCAHDSLSELERDYQFENKKQIINELRQEINGDNQKKSCITSKKTITI